MTAMGMECSKTMNEVAMKSSRRGNMDLGDFTCGDGT